MDSSFYTRVGEGKYEVHFETGVKWKYVLVEAACREAIGHGKALMVTENIVRCGECDHRYDGDFPLQIDHGEMPDNWFCADAERRE